MQDDQVTIDPEFQPPTPDGGKGQWLRLAGVAGVAVAAFILGWLVRSPTPAEPESTELVASTSTTASTGETTTSTTRRSTTTTTTTVAERVGLAVPLKEAMPGFTDTITMAVSTQASTDVLLWWPSEPAPETIVSFDLYESAWEPAWFAGLDASGTWYTVQDGDGVLSVGPVTGVVDDSGGWSSGFRDAVGLRVARSVWHDTEPGRLAWLTCPRTSGGSGTLYTLEVTDGTAEPVPLRPVEDACGENSGVWLGGWGDWGFELRRWEDEQHHSVILLDVDATEMASIGDDGGDTWFVGGPGGTIWTDDRWGPGASSFLLSLDGQRRSPVPGLADDEWVDGAWWSPDGTLLALSPRRAVTDLAPIRIVEVATGTVIAEITEPDKELWPGAWSRDGRFLLYRRGTDDGGWALTEVDLVVYDTMTGATTTVPFPEGQGFYEIRTSEPVPTTEQFTPVEWGIAIDGGGPGVHLVSMEVDVPPVLPDQVDGVSGQLIWDETVVDLCNIGMEMRDAILHIGDTFGTDEGCGANPAAMANAFDVFGLPETACLTVRVDGGDYEYCAPLT